MVKALKLIFCISVILAIWGCSKDNNSSLTAPQDNKYITGLENLSDSLISKDSIPGVIIGVWDESKNISWTKAKGKADKATGRNMSTSDEVRIGSLTKSMVATVILQLADEGKLKLTDKLDKYVTGFPKGDAVDIRMLLNMTSGIFDFDESIEYAQYLLTSPLKKITPQELIDISALYPYNFLPGTNYSYSNTNYILLGIIIEKITGNTADTELKKRIWDQLGMTHTYYPEDEHFRGQYAHGYSSYYMINNGQELDVSNYIHPSLYWMDGGVVSTLDDIKKWIDALVSGSLLSIEMKQAQLDCGIYNYGFAVLKWKNSNYLGHDGHTIGYTAAMAKDPATNTTIIAFTNSAEPVTTVNKKYAWDIVTEVQKILGD